MSYLTSKRLLDIRKHPVPTTSGGDFPTAGGYRQENTLTGGKNDYEEVK